MFRAGSCTGRVLYECERAEIIRPRVRQQHENGGTSEVPLASYQVASCPEQLWNSIVGALIAGVSTRDVSRVQPAKAPGVSKSNVSKHWQAVGHKFVDELRGSDLSENDWAIIMLDGIRLSKDQLAVVAIGITTDGHKHVLDFDSTENAEVCRALMRRLMKRGFQCSRRLFAMLDGSDALRLASQSAITFGWIANLE